MALLLGHWGPHWSSLFSSFSYFCFLFSLGSEMTETVSHPSAFALSSPLWNTFPPLSFHWTSAYPDVHKKLYFMKCFLIHKWSWLSSMHLSLTIQSICNCLYLSTVPSLLWASLMVGILIIVITCSNTCTSCFCYYCTDFITTQGRRCCLFTKDDTEVQRICFICPVSLSW